MRCSFRFIMNRDESPFQQSKTMSPWKWIFFRFEISLFFYSTRVNDDWRIGEKWSEEISKADLRHKKWWLSQFSILNFSSAARKNNFSAFLKRDFVFLFFFTSSLNRLVVPLNATFHQTIHTNSPWKSAKNLSSTENVTPTTKFTANIQLLL